MDATAHYKNRHNLIDDCLACPYSHRVLSAELAARRARLETLILDLQTARDLAIEQTDDREARACQIAIRRLTIILEKLRLEPIAT